MTSPSSDNRRFPKTSEMSLHTYTLLKYSILAKSSLPFKKTNSVTNSKLKIQENSNRCPTLRIIGSSNQELEVHSVDQSMQVWLKEASVLWFKIPFKSIIKRFTVEFLSERHATDIISILKRFNVVVQRPKESQAEQDRQLMSQSQAVMIDQSQFMCSQIPDSQPMNLEDDLSLPRMGDLSLPRSGANVSNLQDSLMDDISVPQQALDSGGSNNDLNSPLFMCSQKISPSFQTFLSQLDADQEVSPSQAVPNPSLSLSNEMPHLSDLQDFNTPSKDYLVEAVIGKRRVDGVLQYLIKFLNQLLEKWKDYCADWTLEDQEKALAYEKSLLQEGSNQDDKKEEVMLPFAFDLDLISNHTLQKWTESALKSENVMFIISKLEPDGEKWKRLIADM